MIATTTPAVLTPMPILSLSLSPLLLVVGEGVIELLLAVELAVVVGED